MGLHRSNTLLRLSLPALLALIGALSLGVSSAAAAPIDLGVYQCPTKPAYTACSPLNGPALDEYKGEFGRYPDIAQNYRSLDEPLLSASELTDVGDRGITPMVTVEPYVGGYGNGVSLRALAQGEYDSFIRSEASVAKKFGGELIVRFAHEMNGGWYDWSAGGGTSSQEYVDAWRHYVDLFRAEGASNVRFVWAPNIDGGLYPFESYFPGDAWVDYVALDGYNWGGSEWLSFADTFAASYDRIARLSGRPVMITETGSGDSGGDKATWIRDAYLKAIPQRFPRVAAVVWFNRDFTAAGERDWRIESSSASTDAYRAVVSNSLYGGTDPAPSFEEPAPAQVTPGRSSKKPTVKVKTVRIKGPDGTAAQASASGAVTAAPRVSVRQVRVVYRLSGPAPVRIAIFDRKRSRPVAATTIGGGRKGAVPLAKLVRGQVLRRGAYKVVVQAIAAGSSQANTRQARLRVL